MEITLDKKNNTEGLIKIKLTEGDYQPNVEEKVKDYARKANIKGFRQGKVPTGVIRKMFGKSILVDEINHLLSHKLSDYIKENNLKILGEPLPNQEKALTIDWDVQKNFEFEYQIGMVDDFPYELSSKVKVPSYPIEVDQKTIDETVSDLKKRFGKVNYPEVSEADDNLFGPLKTAEGDFAREQSFIAVEKVEKKEQKKFIGAKKGDAIEFDIDKAFGDDNLKAQVLGLSPEEAKAVKGKYILTVETISRTEPAELNIELFDRVFGKDVVTDEAGFIAKIKETIGENYKRESDHFLEHHIEDHFVANTSINLPDDFLKAWLKSSSQGQVTDEVLGQEFEAYKRGLKWDLVKNRIADDNKITVEADEVRAKAKDLIISQFGGHAFAEQLGDKLDAIADNYLQNENGQNFMKLYNQLRSEKILKYIREHITVQEKKVTVDEFKKIVEEHKH
ncbi:trigger factor [Chryseolinea soli]|uniref:Trigger factor n=1 Tax=Chryseolinea soli TaxID=2321403 RepID=A0A385SH26_9BACT|nr:trigger factor [Chryseolinea soli]AYB29726.1 trigger factor [Chryseolinea soli]